MEMICMEVFQDLFKTDIEPNIKGQKIKPITK